MSIDAYYPTYWLKRNPIHEVRDWCYVRRLVRAARRGEVIPPVLIDGRIGGGNMLTGTHRAAANDLMMRLGGEPLIDVVSIDDIDVPDSLQDAINNLDYELRARMGLADICRAVAVSDRQRQVTPSLRANR